MPHAQTADWLLGQRPSHWWTGKEPAPKMHSLPQLQWQDITRQDVLNYFDNGWTLTEVLFSALQGEEAFLKVPVHGLRHPLIFYYGHPAVLYVNKLRVAGLLSEGVNTEFESILEVGVDEMSWDDMSKNEMKWPSVKDVHAYRQNVYRIIRQLILEDPRLDPKTQKFSQSSPLWSLIMGFEHERIHLETSSVLMRELPLKYLTKPAQWPASADDSSSSPILQPLKWIGVDQGSVDLGKPTEVPSFGWDNEYGQRRLDIPAFKTTQTLITNGQYLEFVKAGGYQEKRFWSVEGWGWKSFRNTKTPPFWVNEGPQGLHQYKIRTIFEVIDFKSDWPVIANFHEAKAFSVWKTEVDQSALAYRLLTEGEHHRLRPTAAAIQESNLNLKWGSENSVYKKSNESISDVFGNVWQWCEDAFNPLENFKVHPYYEDFSTPCFDGRHQMIMGGSFVSTGDEAESYARFHFRPHFFQHAGFRLVQPQENKVKSASNYESSELLSQYLLLHFGSQQETVPYSFAPVDALEFPQRCADIVIQTAQELKIPMRSALDVGCAVGGSSFKLSTAFEKVIGVDLSHSFIQAALELKNSGSLNYDRKDQGLIKKSLVAHRPSYAQPERIEFFEADACQLLPVYKNFDAVLMANLLCRLPDPVACLNSMKGPNSVLNSQGLLVLFSPYSWLEEHTPVSTWLGGQVKDGQPLKSAQAIQQTLGDEFKLLKTADVPLLIQEHERKYQYIISHMMIFQKK